MMMDFVAPSRLVLITSIVFAPNEVTSSYRPPTLRNVPFLTDSPTTTDTGCFDLLPGNVINLLAGRVGDSPSLPGSSLGLGVDDTTTSGSSVVSGVLGGSTSVVGTSVVVDGVEAMSLLASSDLPGKFRKNTSPVPRIELDSTVAPDVLASDSAV